MKPSPSNRAFAGASLALAALTFWIFDSAPAAAAEWLAKLSFTEKAIVFEPVVEYERLLLTVSGPDTTINRSYKERPVLAFEELNDGRPPHGSFTYELRRVPRVDPEVRERLAAVRSRGDERDIVELRSAGLLPEGPFVQSGTFTFAEGRPVDRGLEEKGASRLRSEEGTLQIAGDLEVAGAKKFRMVDPDDGREILFAALEGPEVGTYFRGSARLVAGEAVVELPPHFTRATENEGLTVQLTPVGGWSRLYVGELTSERLVVRAADDTPDVRFDFLVQGVRRGYAGFEVDRD